jgi:acetolactate synthase-1/2/3 large subunit
MKTTGAGLITHLLERQGVTTVAGIPGGANLPLYDALRTSGIRHVLARHEQGAGFIAQGMARASGRPAVCLASSGPGATNLVTAIADAHMDSIPLVAITGQVPRALLGTNAFQEIDTPGLAEPITKHVRQVRSAAELVEAVPEAFRIAMSGRRGPVVLDVPKDVQLESIEVGPLPAPATSDPPPIASEDAMNRALALLDAAERPMMLVGAGVIAAGASDLVRMLAERATIPVAATLHGLGALPPDHPLWLGMVGMHAARCTNMVLDECDLLLGLGVRFDDRATGKLSEFAPNAKIVHVDIDPRELGKLVRPTVGIRADVGAVLAEMTTRVRPSTRPAWRDRVATLRARHPLATPGADDPREVYGMIRAIGALLEPDDLVATDVGQHQMWVAQAYPLSRPRRWLTSGGLGTMGFGVPAAIGAALACPERRVVCFTGDGSVLMNLQELGTAAEEGVSVTVIVLDNGHLGLVRQQQELFYGGRFHASRFRREPDFVAIARGFGVSAWDMGASDDPIGVLARALGTPGPSLVRVPVLHEEKVWPMVPPGAANREMLEAAP